MDLRRTSLLLEADRQIQQARREVAVNPRDKRARRNLARWLRRAGKHHQEMLDLHDKFRGALEHRDGIRRKWARAEERHERILQLVHDHPVSDPTLTREEMRNHPQIDEWRDLRDRVKAAWRERSKLVQDHEAAETATHRANMDVRNTARSLGISNPGKYLRPRDGESMHSHLYTLGQFEGGHLHYHTARTKSGGIQFKHTAHGFSGRLVDRARSRAETFMRNARRHWPGLVVHGHGHPNYLRGHIVYYAHGRTPGCCD